MRFSRQQPPNPWIHVSLDICSSTSSDRRPPVPPFFYSRDRAFGKSSTRDSLLFHTTYSRYSFFGSDALYRRAMLTARWHTEALVTGLINFHKMQCYFASTTQIAALVLAHDSQKDTAILFNNVYMDTGSYRDFLDTSFLVLLALSAIIPITVSLACATRYGRQSWFILIFSLVAFVLSTATLSNFYLYANKFGEPGDFYSPIGNENYIGDTNYAIGGTIADSLFPLCGTSWLDNNSLSASTLTSSWVWVAWVNCFIWMFLCFMSKLSGNKCIKSGLDRFGSILDKLQHILAIMGRDHIPAIIFAIASLLCFAAQFYLLSVFGRHSFISPEWSFGQIIAVNVWVPAIVEYIYIEYSKFHTDSN